MLGNVAGSLLFRFSCLGPPHPDLLNRGRHGALRPAFFVVRTSVFTKLGSFHFCIVFPAGTSELGPSNYRNTGFAQHEQGKRKVVVRHFTRCDIQRASQGMS